MHLSQMSTHQSVVLVSPYLEQKILLLMEENNGVTPKL